MAVRGSGTEPKIKYYLFAQRRPERRGVHARGARGDQTAGRREAGSALGVAAGGCRESNRLRLAERPARRKFPSRCSTSGRPQSQFLVSEIKLNGGEITILKTLGLTGSTMAGTQLVDRIEEMEGAEFLDTLTGLMSMDYVVANKVNIRTMDSVKEASFRVNAAHVPRIARSGLSVPASQAGYGTAPAAVLIFE